MRIAAALVSMLMKAPEERAVRLRFDGCNADGTQRSD
jgi:hypothetical protein